MTRFRAAPRSELLVVCGEPSGDVMGAEALALLDRPAFGVGGPALRSQGLTSVLPMEQLSAMGSGAARKLLRLSEAWWEVQRAVRQRAPTVALLVGFSEFNARLGRWLRARRVRVVWYAPPQIWAWRPERGPSLLESADHLALILPFEAALWRGLGAPVTYVGHPALGWRLLGMKRVQGRVALLPGSRAQEVARLWPRLTQAVEHLRRSRPDWSFELSISPGLPAATRAELSRAARHVGIPASNDARAVLARAELSLCCSGTATLQSALSCCPPVIAYPTSRLAAAALRRLVRVPHIGLPNLVLDRRAFPELVGEAVQPAQLASSALELEQALPLHLQSCKELETRLRERVEQAPARCVAQLVERYA